MRRVALAVVAGVVVEVGSAFGDVEAGWIHDPKS